MQLVDVPTSTPLTNDEKQLLVDYFNLCGEEHQIWKQGFVYPEVWRAWENGMRQYVSDPRIRAFWEKERSTNSYYGLEEVLG